MDLDLFDSFSDTRQVDVSNLSSEFSTKKRSLSDRNESDDAVPNAPSQTSSNLTKVRKVDIQPSSVVTSTASGDPKHVTATESVVDVQNLVQKPPAKVYKFNLDPFQREAVNYIERDESVLVAAHTSAGKTAVAEYAIAKSFRDKQRVIYTSPIKALSNQKYRDLQEEFGDVGLMTGDMTINPSATCLIMTTEILRSMLYRGSEVVREVAWVIYDEVHYMRDKERGVVWEESIILLPHKVRFVFLSATIPNAPSFVSWISKVHHQPCHVVYTDYRPVPLQHYVFPASAEGLYLVVDEKGKFREENFQKAMAILQPPSLQDSGEFSEKKQNRKQITKNLTNDLLKIIQLIMQKKLDPCIIFSFSKKDCEAYALKMASFEFNTPDEKTLVEQVFFNAIEALSEDDKTLPQITTILPLLKRGVGIHHGGLLPILKEVIEILFQEGLLKCLFATETFSIGINMPAKTVVFTRTRKFDGKDFRWITSGEYIQMSGRAGRRGKDDKGIVIQMLDEKMEPDIAKNMIYGASDPLYSSYHIGYNMVLNMMRVEGADPEKLIKSSFHQYQQELNSPNLLREAKEIEDQASKLFVPNESLVEEYIYLVNTIKEIKSECNKIIMDPVYVAPFLVTGRMVRVEFNGKEWGWGVVLGLKKVDHKPLGSTFDVTKFIGRVNSKRSPPEQTFFVDILLEVVRKNSNESSDSVGSHLMIDFVSKGTQYEKGMKDVMQVHASLEALGEVSAVKLTIPKDFKAGTRNTVWTASQEVLRRFLPPQGTGMPTVEPVKDMSIPPEKIEHKLGQLKRESQRLSDEKFRVVDKQDIALLQSKKNLLDEAKKFRKEATELQSVTMRDELKKMKKVLRRMEYVNAEGVLSAKGRFACEVTAGDELLLTNMVFGGMFNELTVEQTVAILSSLVHKEPGSNDSSSGSTPRMRPDMQKPFRQLQATAKEIAKVCIEVRLFTEEQEYVDSFVPVLIDVAYAWASGAKFSEICKLTDVFEGSIIRSLRRLEELLRQLASASLAIGNNELVALFTEGATKIRRGVVFAASLYI